MSNDRTNDRGVPLNGAQAMLQGWDLKANPYARMRDRPANDVEAVEWIADWWAANAACMRDYVHPDGPRAAPIAAAQAPADSAGIRRPVPLVLQGLLRPVALTLSRWRHRKRDRHYVLLTGGKVQISTELRDGDSVLIYVGNLGDVWVRGYDEFHDGRFEKED